MEALCEPGCVEMFGVVLLFLGAIFCAAILAAFTAWTAWARPRGKALILFAASLPFLVLGWLVVVIGFATFVDSFLNHGYTRVGDEGWQVSLYNGYYLEMFDTETLGTLHSESNRLSVEGVRQLHSSKDFVAGTSASTHVLRLSKSIFDVDEYFLLDTKTSALQNFDSLNGLRAAVRDKGIDLKLDTLDVVYERLHVQLPPIFWWTLLLPPPLLLVALLLLLLLKGRSFPESVGLPPLAAISKLYFGKGYIRVELDTAIWQSLEPGIEHTVFQYAYLQLTLLSGRIGVYNDKTAFSEITPTSKPEHASKAIVPGFRPTSICFADDLIASLSPIPAIAAILFCVFLCVPLSGPAPKPLRVLDIR
jgi:hypothetical protein